jgi:hypothetical protein
LLTLSYAFQIAISALQSVLQEDFKATEISGKRSRLASSSDGEPSGALNICSPKDLLRNYFFSSSISTILVTK